MTNEKVELYAGSEKWPRMLTPEQEETFLKFVDSRPDFEKNPRGKLDAKSMQKLWDEIPIEVKPTATAILTVCKFLNEHGLQDDPYNCLLFRCIFYEVIEESKKKNGTDLPVPRAWWTDGPHIPPEWVIRVTNGIVRWKGDMSCELCHGGPGGDCPYCLTDDEFKEMDNEREKVSHDRVRKVLEDLNGTGDGEL